MRYGACLRVNQGGTTITIVPCAISGVRGFFCTFARAGGDILSNIKYNEQEEAFELPYKLWGETATVRFYVEDENAIMQNLKVIAEKLAKLDGGRKQIAELLIDDGFYEGGDSDALAKILSLQNPYVDIDDEDIIVCFDAGTDDGYMKDYAHIELFGDIFEITGWVNG